MVLTSHLSGGSSHRAPSDGMQLKAIRFIRFPPLLTIFHFLIPQYYLPFSLLLNCHASSSSELPSFIPPFPPSASLHKTFFSGSSSFSKCLVQETYSSMPFLSLPLFVLSRSTFLYNWLFLRLHCLKRQVKKPPELKLASKFWVPICQYRSRDYRTFFSLSGLTETAIAWPFLPDVFFTLAASFDVKNVPRCIMHVYFNLWFPDIFFFRSRVKLPVLDVMVPLYSVCKLVSEVKS